MQVIILKTDPQYPTPTPRAVNRLVSVLECGFFHRPTLLPSGGGSEGGSVRIRLLAHETWWNEHTAITDTQYWNWPGSQQDPQYQRGYLAREMLDEILADVCWDDILEAEDFEREHLDIFHLEPTDTTPEESPPALLPGDAQAVRVLTPPAGRHSRGGRKRREQQDFTEKSHRTRPGAVRKPRSHPTVQLMRLPTPAEDSPSSSSSSSS